MADQSVRLAELTTRLHELPLIRPWGADVTCNYVIEVRVRDSEGRTGVGLSWTPTIGVHAVRALIDHDIRAAVVGGPIEPEDVWPALWRHLHEAGRRRGDHHRDGRPRPGLVGPARQGAGTVGGRSARSPARRRRGVRERCQPALLAGGVVAQARRWVDAGFGAAKIKVGKPDLAEDVDRVAAVREVLGPDRELMIDANQRWDLDRATTVRRGARGVRAGVD